MESNKIEDDKRADLDTCKDDEEEDKDQRKESHRIPTFTDILFSKVGLGIAISVCGLGIFRYFFEEGSQIGYVIGIAIAAGGFLYVWVVDKQMPWRNG